MNLTELNKVAEAMVAPGRGILAADESTGTIKKRFDAIGVESTPINRRDYREMLFRIDRGDVEIHFRRHSLRRDHPAERQGRHAAGQAHRKGRRAARHQGRQGHQAAAVLPRRSHHRRARRPARAARRISRARRQIRQVARGDRYRRRHPELQRHHDQRPRARALCRAVPGRRHRADRRARSADGRRPRHRPLRAWSPNGCSRPCSSSFTISASRSKAWCSSRTWWCPARSRRKRASVEEVAEKTVRVLKACVPAAVPGIAFLSGGQSDEEATAHLDAMNKMGPLPWRRDILLRPRAAGGAAKGLVGQAGKCRRRAARLRPPRHR